MSRAAIGDVLQPLEPFGFQAKEITAACRADVHVQRDRRGRYQALSGADRAPIGQVRRLLPGSSACPAGGAGAPSTGHGEAEVVRTEEFPAFWRRRGTASRPRRREPGTFLTSVERRGSATCTDAGAVLLNWGSSALERAGLRAAIPARSSAEAGADGNCADRRTCMRSGLCATGHGDVMSRLTRHRASWSYNKAREDTSRAWRKALDDNELAVSIKRRRSARLRRLRWRPPRTFP